jgi:hypothetical protein
MRWVKATLLGLLIAVFLALGMVPALADQVNGQGQTPLSASLGFNAKSDLSGEMNYNADPKGPNGGFSAHCSDFVLVATGTSIDGYPKITVKAACTDQDGATAYLKAGFVDRGEPGKNDSMCLLWTYSLPFSRATAYINDRGTISHGNIQIHLDEQDRAPSHM